LGGGKQRLARRWVTAVLRPIDQRPKGTGNLGLFGGTTKKPSADPERYPAAQRQGFHLPFTPWKGLQEGQPGVFELR
jgi:hypothetical protein